MARNRLASAPLITPARVVGLLLSTVGIVLLVLTWAAQSDIDEIGNTNDPLLQHRVNVLEDQRNLYLIAGIGMLFIGIFALGMLVEPAIATMIPRSEMISVAKMAGDALNGLSLAGNSSYIPARHGLTKERVFISATSNGSTPPRVLTDDLVLSPGKDGSSPGMLSEPFGLSLLNTVEEELNTKIDGVGLEAAEATLQILKHGFEMMKDFHFKERDGKTVLRVEYSGLLDACRTVRKERPDTCRQMECIGCSCLLTAAARATGKIVSIEEVDNAKDTVTFTLSLKEW